MRRNSKPGTFVLTVQELL